MASNQGASFFPPWLDAMRILGKKRDVSPAPLATPRTEAPLSKDFGDECAPSEILGSTNYTPSEKSGGHTALEDTTDGDVTPRSFGTETVEHAKSISVLEELADWGTLQAQILRRHEERLSLESMFDLSLASHVLAKETKEPATKELMHFASTVQRSSQDFLVQWQEAFHAPNIGDFQRLLGRFEELSHYKEVRAGIVEKVHLYDQEKQSASAQLVAALQREETGKHKTRRALGKIGRKMIHAPHKSSTLDRANDVLAAASQKLQDQEEKLAEITDRYVMLSRSLLASTSKEEAEHEKLVSDSVWRAAASLELWASNAQAVLSRTNEVGTPHFVEGESKGFSPSSSLCITHKVSSDLRPEANLTLVDHCPSTSTEQLEEEVVKAGLENDALQRSVPRMGLVGRRLSKSVHSSATSRIKSDLENEVCALEGIAKACASMAKAVHADATPPTVPCLPVPTESPTEPACSSSSIKSQSRRRSSEGLVSLPPNPFCVDLTDEEPVDTDVTSKNSSSMNCGIQSGAGGSLARWGAWTPLSHRYSDATVPFRCLDVLNKDADSSAEVLREGATADERPDVSCETVSSACVEVTQVPPAEPEIRIVGLGLCIGTGNRSRLRFQWSEQSTSLRQAKEQLSEALKAPDLEQSILDSDLGRRAGRDQGHWNWKWSSYAVEERHDMLMRSCHCPVLSDEDWCLFSYELLLMARERLNETAQQHVDSLLHISRVHFGLASAQHRHLSKLSLPNGLETYSPLDVRFRALLLARHWAQTEDAHRATLPSASLDAEDGWAAAWVLRQLQVLAGCVVERTVQLKNRGHDEAKRIGIATLHSVQRLRGIAVGGRWGHPEQYGRALLVDLSQGLDALRPSDFWRFSTVFAVRAFGKLWLAATDRDSENHMSFDAPMVAAGEPAGICG